MKQLKYPLIGLLIMIGSFASTALMSETITLVNSIGEKIHLEIGDAEPFLEVVDRIQTCYAEIDEEALKPKDEGIQQFANQRPLLNNSRFNFEISSAGVTVRAKKTAWRDYSISVAKEDKKDIHFIITTLARDSLIRIGTSRSSLKRAGERIDHLHPFRFLMAIFTDEELKAGAHAIRDRGGWTWEGFTDGIIGSLKEEAARDNVLQFASDFAKKVKIDSSLITPLLEKGKWEDFVNVLIDKIPRDINPNRYDM